MHDRFSASPRLDTLRIGVVERTPPLDVLLQSKLDPIVYFANYDYVNISPGQIVTDVATGKINVALVWGPVRGYLLGGRPGSLLTEAFG